MKKKIIIHNGNIGIGGQEKMLIQFLNILSPEKYEVLLLIEEDKGIENAYLTDIPKWVQYEFLTTEKFMSQLEKYKRNKNIIRKLMYSIYLTLKKRIAIKKTMKFLSYSDIIIDYDMGLLRKLHKLKLDNKVIVGWSHAGQGQLPSNSKKRKNLEKYDYIVTINEEMKKGYERNTKHPKILKIYNFMDFKEILAKSNAKIIDNYNSYILNIGSLTENKNQRLLIRAFANLKKNYDIAEKLILIGEGKEKQQLLKLINELNMEEEIFLLGQKKNPYKYIKNSLLYVICSKNEGLPLTCIEALALGKMVIATNTNGTREILENSKYGKIIEKDSIESLEKNLYFYIKNKDAREEYENNALKRAEVFKKEKARKVIEEFMDRL